MPDQYDEQLRVQLTPVLRGAGFKGSGRRFRRESGCVLQTFTIQGARTGGSCCVELGVHLSFLPTPQGGAADPKKLTSYDCEFRRRLAPDGREDAWWTYGTTLSAAIVSVADLVATTKSVALPFFARFAEFPGAFASVTPSDIATAIFGNLPGRTTQARCSLTMARVALHLKRPQDAIAFAKVGLLYVGHAIYVQRELEALIASAQATPLDGP